ncbi:MAG: tRNA (adenosine(37)-N6)-threonylcarbamoyltransferase complex ATPase subunit type 1 TsaE [Desulfobacterota bacterium]|nr:tRNA (adenosine(37)-N6)-threonylcarbamoyltransferase complex ATPase subunit type 1 TsaE [Thermodesulfobacteriota bacterium]
MIDTNKGERYYTIPLRRGGIGRMDDYKSRGTVMSLLSRSPEETCAFGEYLGSMLFPGSVVGLVGELGAGKTCCIKGIVRGVNGTSYHDVTSPTFAIIHEYSGKIPVVHVDAYRIGSNSELEAIGFDEYLEVGNVVVVEWADRILNALPEQYLMIAFDVFNEYERRIVCRANGEPYRAVIEQLSEHYCGMCEC